MFYVVLQVTIYDMYEVVLLLYVETFDGDNVTGQVDGYIYIYIYLSIYTLPTIDCLGS